MAHAEHFVMTETKGDPMNRKQLQSLIVASVFVSALFSGRVYADDKAMDPNMPMNNAAPAKPAGTSMPMDAKKDAMPVKHHHKKHKAMTKPADDMTKPADSMAKPAGGM